MKPQFIKTILISLLFFQTTIYPIFGLSRSFSPSPDNLSPATPVISVPDSNVKTPSRLQRIARKITTTVGRITLVTVLAGGTTASFEATPGHNVALSSGKFVPVSALATNDCLHTFDGQCARVVSLTTRDGTFPVYDLEVEEDHTFAVTRLGIVVHNSNLDQITKDICEFAQKSADSIKGALAGLLEKRFADRLKNLLSTGHVPERYGVRVEKALAGMSAAEQEKAISLMEKIAAKMKKGKAVQDHHWIGKSLQKEYGNYLKKVDIDLEKDNLLLLVIGHTGKHKESFFNLSRTELDRIVDKFPNPAVAGRETILTEIKKSGYEIREKVRNNQSIMNNTKFIILE